MGGSLFAWLVHLRQVHPLKLAASVQICEICGRSSPAAASVNSVQSVGGHPQQAEAIRGSLFSAPLSHPVTNIACYSVRRTARGQTGAGMELTGAGGEYRALLH